MKYDNDFTQSSWRFYLIVGVVIFVLLGVLARLVYLTVIDRTFLTTQGDARSLRVVSTQAYRGMILDRNGNPLAVSTPVDSVWINPQLFPNTDEAIHAVARVLSLPVDTLTALLKKNSRKQFVYIKRGVTPEISQQIEALQLPGLSLKHMYRRYYPDGEAIAQVIGFTDIDNKGQEGIELAYNNELQGIPGKTLVEQDRYGRSIAVLKQVQAERPGANITLSIDKHIQFVAFNAVKEAVKKFKAVSGMAIVLRTKTGEVLAMANWPSYNPNNRVSDAVGHYRNRTVTDITEPGSVMKTFAVVNALDSGKYTPNSEFNTHPGWMKVGHNIVRDEENDHGTLTLTGVLQKSSNVGITKAMLSLPPDSLFHVLKRFGFGENTGLHFPGEQKGVLVNHKRWADISVATLAFGYGMSATAAQVVRGYSVFANEGKLLPLTLLKQNPEDQPSGTMIIKPKVSHEILTMLESVMSLHGTGYLARVPGYRIAGKTGTARMAIPGGYSPKKHISSFIGIAPASDPELIVFVVIQEPHGAVYYASYVAAPAFSEIMSTALRRLNIPPDDVASEAEVLKKNWKAPV